MALGRLIAGVAGLALTVLGGWVVGLPLLAYSLLPVFRGLRKARGSSGLSFGQTPGFLLLLLAGISAASGGKLSVPVLSSAGLAVLLWSRIPFPGHDWAPVEESLLLRSRLVPFQWAVVSEVKAGEEDASRALSSFTGWLVVRTKTGEAHAVSTFRALGRSAAEAKASAILRGWTAPSSPGVLLLPLAGADSTKPFRNRVEEVEQGSRLLEHELSSIPELLVLDSQAGVVVRTGAYRIVGAAEKASFPRPVRGNPDRPQLWEFTSALSRHAPIGTVDELSTFLQSLAATRGLPLSQRVEELSGEGPSVKARTLTGEEVGLSRPQFRALISMYD